MSRPKHILVVDDDPHIRKLITTCLTNQGFQVKVAHNGKDGLEMVKQLFPDLVLLDLNMPVMSGEAMCREIKDGYDKKLRSVPILMLTGKTSDVDRVVGMVMGANGYLTKPFDVKNLLESIQGILND